MIQIKQRTDCLSRPQSKPSYLFFCNNQSKTLSSFPGSTECGTEKSFLNCVAQKNNNAIAVFHLHMDTKKERQNSDPFLGR